jgi:hypothetical protein
MQKFDAGRLVATPGALAAFEAAGEEPWPYLMRHLAGDWGELDEEDKQENEYALRNSLRVLSAYPLKTGQRVWVITEADRSVTTFLLPSEY